MRLEPQTGTAFELNKGQLLRVIDLEGEQVADLVSFNRADRREWLSSCRTIDYANTIYLTKGHLLYSNRSRPMFTILQDDVGRHDFLLTPCSTETFRILYRNEHPHPSCFSNLTTHLAALRHRGGRDSHNLESFHERRNRQCRDTFDSSAAFKGRRQHYAARRDGLDRRPYRVLRGDVEQLQVQAGRL